MDKTIETSSRDLGRALLDTGLAGDGALRWVATDMTELLEVVRQRLDLSPIAAAAFGRTLSGTAMILRLMTKTPARLMLDVRGDGPIQRVFAEADQEGALRGAVGVPRVTRPLRQDGKLDVGGAVGRGTLAVTREDPQGKRYQSQVRLISGEIGEDVAHYLEQSEQTRSAVLLGVLGRPRGIASAGGMIVEVLPGASSEVLDRLECNLAEMAGVSRVIEEGGVSLALDRVLAGLKRVSMGSRPLVYRCRCDRDRLAAQLAALSDEEIDSISDSDGKVAADCQFCGEQYRYQASDLRNTR